MSFVRIVIAAFAAGLSFAAPSGAVAQYYSPYYRPAPPTYVIPANPPSQRFIPLDDDDDDFVQPQRARPRAQQKPRAAAPRRQAAVPDLRDDLFEDAQPRSQPRRPRGQATRDPWDANGNVLAPAQRNRAGNGARSAPRVAALPADADPGYSSGYDYDDEVDLNRVTRRVVADPTGQGANVLTIDTRARKLYLSLGNGQAMQYGIGVGRQGFAWKGSATIGRKAVWPGWTPPPEMLERRPDLPQHMEGGINNPLGARALYLFQGNKDTLFRIHGTNEPESIGRAVSSGCIRMHNADVMDLYQRVAKGAKVVVI